MIKTIKKVTIILSVVFLPKIFRIDVEKEREVFFGSMLEVAATTEEAGKKCTTYTSAYFLYRVHIYINTPHYNTHINFGSVRQNMTWIYMYLHHVPTYCNIRVPSFTIQTIFYMLKYTYIILRLGILWRSVNCIFCMYVALAGVIK